MRAVQLLIKRLSLRRPESVFRCFDRLNWNKVCRTIPLLACALLPTQLLSWRLPFDADHNLSVGSHNATILSFSRIHRSRHRSSVLRLPTRLHEE